MKTKKCTNCNESKPATIEFFVSRKGTKSGIRNQCKDCKNKKLNKSRQKNPERRRELDRINYENNKDRIKKYIADYRASKPDYEKIKYKRKKDLITKSYVASSMRRRVSELDDRIYETQKLIIKIKRELNKTES